MIAHAALFAGLALCLMILLTGQPKHRAVTIALVVLACAASGQETLQFISRGTLPVGDTLFDLAVDMTSGGVIVMGACWLVARRGSLT